MSKLDEIARTSVRGGLLLFIGVTLSTFINGVKTIIVARLLGPEDYGLLTATLIVPSLLITLIDVGISPALTRFSAILQSEGKNERLAYFIKSGILFKIILSIVISSFLLLASEGIATHLLNRPNIAFFIRISSLSIIGQSILNSICATYIGLDQAEKSSVFLNLQALIDIITSPILIILGLGITGAIIGKSIGLILAASVGTIILFIWASSSLGKNDLPVDYNGFFEGLRIMMTFGAPLYISTIIGSLNGQIQQILLTRYVSNINIGNYQTARNFSIIINLLMSPIATVLFPAFSKLNFEKDRDSIDKMFKLSVKYTSFLVIPFSIIIAVLSNNIIAALYGLQYQSAPMYLTFYILRFLLTTLGMGVIGALFNGQGDTKTTLKINFLYLLFTNILASFMIPKYGVNGLIASNLLSQLILSIYGLFLIKQMYNIKIEWLSSVKILIVSFLSAFPVYILKEILNNNFIYTIMLSGGIYLILLLFFAPIFGAINYEDLMNLEYITRGNPLISKPLRYIIIIEQNIIELKASLFHN